MVDVPPLRARPGDILPIARRLLSHLEEELGPRDLTPAAIARLSSYDFPGNVRELRNVLYRAADLSRGARWLDAALIDRAIRKPKPLAIELTRTIAEECLERARGNVSAAARAAGVPRTTFRKVMGEFEGPGPKKVL